MAKWRILALVLASAALICALALPALAQEGGFSDTFDGPALQGWEHSDGVLVRDGALHIGAGNMAFRLGSWSQPTIHLRLRYTPPGEVTVHYHATDAGAYNLHLNEEGVWLDKIVERAPTTLGRAEQAPGPAGEWLDLAIAYDGRQHQVSLGGAVVLTAEDAEPLTPGAIGVTVMGENAADVDDLTVTAAAAERPGAGEPPGPGEPPASGEPNEAAAPALQPTPAATAVPAGGTGLAGLLDALFPRPGNLVDPSTFLINLGLAALLAFILGRVYIHWGASLSNRRKFAANFLLITVTTTFIILVVRSSVALSLGLVGALSIVRFRAAIKEPEELAYLFLCVGLGIGLGDNQRVITILAFAVAVALVGLVKLLGRPGADVNLHLTVASRNPDKLDAKQVMQALAPHCPKMRLLRLDENEEQLEMSFVVEFRRTADLNAARDAIHGLSKSAEITFLDNRGIW